MSWEDWYEARELGKWLPDDLKSMEWKPTAKDQSAAWTLFTEMRTRIVTQPLQYRAGDEEAALTSVYQLFDFTRDAIKEGGIECHHFATLSTLMLNEVVRPFTAKWHRRKEEGDLKIEFHCREFRAELQWLQQQLRPFEASLQSLALGTGIAPAAISKPPGLDLLTRESRVKWPDSARSRKKRIVDAIEEDLPGNIITSVRMSVEPEASRSNSPQPVGWNDIQAKEAEHIRERRSAASQPVSNDNLVGLSFSGGGIRAATFALGVIQRLAKQNLLPHVDYLSTVSGGGYCGSFLSSYLNSSNPDVGLGAGKIPLDKTIAGVESAALRHIRNHSKYLSYGGAWRNLQIAGLGLNGILINLAVMLPILVLIVVASEKLMGLSQVIKLSKAPPMFANPVVAGLWCLVLLLTLGCGAFVSLVLRNSETARIQNPDPTRSKETQYGRSCLTMLGVFLFMTLALVWPIVVWFVAHTLKHLEPIDPRVIGVLSSPFLLRMAGSFAPATKWVNKCLMILFAVSGPLAILTAYFVLFFHFIVKMPGSGFGVLALMFVIPVLYSYFLLDVNFNSPHAFYRNRLTDAYLIKPTSTIPEVVDHQKLTALRSQRKEIPYHLINGVLNAQASKNPNLRGRLSDFFLFSQAFCGSPLSGYFPTSEFERLDSHLDLGTAMAISGAAASPNMGALTDDKARFWLTLFNLRLGYWLKNPQSADQSRWPGLRYLFREMRGDLAEDMPYINVSDGGHLDNLGFYELLRRQCKFIIAVDSEADPQMECASLMRVLRLVEIDFGIKIHISTRDFQLQSTGYSKAAFTLGVIDYGPSDKHPVKDNDRRLGVLIYLKNTLTGSESSQLREYAKRKPPFPHVDVIDQFFDEEQFETFRSLGYHVASQALADEFFNGQVPTSLDVKSWAKQLVNSLYSD